MPSGAKKRKAAKRKKEMAGRLVDPPPQDDGHQDDLMRPEDSKESDGGSPRSSSSSPSPRDKHRSPSAEELLGSEAVVIDSAANSGEGVALAEEAEVESAVAMDVAFTTTVESIAESETLVVESTKSETEDEKPAEESAVRVEKIVPLVEECTQVDEIAAKVLEEPSGEVRVKIVPLPNVDEVLKQLGEDHVFSRVSGKAETSPTSQVVPPAPLVVHHTKWWNCCGLLDVFAGSGR